MPLTGSGELFKVIHYGRDLSGELFK
jgi:hypothetical protein